MKFKIVNFFLPVCILTLLCLASCKEDMEEQTFEPERMFMPTGDIQSAGFVTSVKLIWKESLYADPANTSYTIEVASDTLFQTPVVYTATTDTAGITITDENLGVRQRYFARVKTNATGNIPESKWVVSSGFLIPGEQIFTSTRTIDRAVALGWRQSPGLTKIVLTPAGGTSFDVALSETDNAAGSKIVENLTANTSYTAEIFAGTRSRGYLTFRTEEPLSGNLIDLRGITGKASALADTLLDVADGSIIILKRGETYTISSGISLSKSFTIMSGPSLTNPDRAIIFFTNNFNFVDGSTIDKIEFKDVIIRSDNYSGRYVFNTTGGATVNTISFDGCHAEIFRGLVRLQSGSTTVNNFVVNNSILDSLANYGVLTVDNATCMVNNIAIKNSTIYKAEKVITSRQNSVSVVIENSTFNEAVRGGDTNYLIDYSVSATNTVSQGIIITNSILGVGKSGAANRTVRGIRTNESTPIQVNNSYKTADYVATSNLIPNLTDYSGTSFNLFTDPKNGNFTIKDAGFTGKATAGDPRWRP